MTSLRKLFHAACDRIRHCEPWSVALSAAISLAAVSDLVFGLFDGVRALNHFYDRAIGITILEAVDASGYARNYVLLNFLFLAIFFIVLALLARGNDYLRSRIDPELIASEKNSILMLSELFIALILLRLIISEHSSRALGNAPYLLLFLVALLLAVIFAKILVHRRGDHAPGSWPGVAGRLLADQALLTAGLFYPFPFLFAYWIACRKPLSFANYSTPLLVLGYLAALAVLFLLYGLAVRRWVLGKDGGEDATAKIRAFNARCLVAGIPLLLIPISIPLANELQYNFPGLSPRLLSALAILALGVAGVLVFVGNRRGWPVNRTPLLIPAVYFPIFITTSALFKMHHHVLDLKELDYFHLGEMTLPTQQFFHFGSLPLLDLRLAHTFSDMFFQTLYTWCNGDHGLDMLMWLSWALPVATVVLLYFFIAKIASPLFALLVTSLLPVLGLVSAYYALVLVPALFLCHALTRPAWGRFVGVWVSAVLLLLWRVDFGLVGLVALALVLVAYGWRAELRRLKVMVGSLLVVAAISALVLVCLIWLSERSVIDSLLILFRSYSLRLITRTRSAIIDDYNVMAVFQYYLLPAVSLIYLAYFGTRRVIRNEQLPPYKYMLTFIAAFSLIISTRALERHSLIEGFKTYLFVLLWAALPFMLAKTPALRNSTAARAYFLGVLLLNTLFLYPPSGPPRRNIGMYHTIKRGDLFRLRRWSADERRVFFEEARHRGVVSFLTTHLEGDETFFDFTNSPLLYLFTDKKFPTYVIPNLEQTSEKIQDRVVADLTTLREQDRLPFVVFKQGISFWDNTDDVANEIRCYRIAEFIYRHYFPIVDLNGYQVWQQKGREVTDLDAGCRRQELSMRADFMANQMTRLSEGDTGGIVFQAEDGDPYVFRLLALEPTPPLDGDGYWTLRFRYGSSVVGNLQVFFQTDSGTFAEERSAWLALRETEPGEYQEGIVPVRYEPEAMRLTDVRFDPPGSSRFELAGAELLRCGGPMVALDPEDMTQSFHLRRLPYVWATHDPLDAVHRTEVIAELTRGPIVLAPGEDLVVALPPQIDKTRGNYLHLRLASGPTDVRYFAAGESPTVSVTYGSSPQSSFMFEAVPYDLSGFAKRYPLDPLPDLDYDRDWYLKFSYRSTAAGAMRVFFAFDGQDFQGQDAKVIRVQPTARHEPAREVLVPILRPGPASQWTDLRFELPKGSVVEILQPEILGGKPGPLDHLIRLSSQWKWMHEPIGELTLRSSQAVVIDKVILRQGD